MLHVEIYVEDPAERARMLRRASLAVEDGNTFGDVTDDLGERVGYFYVTEDAEAVSPVIIGEHWADAFRSPAPECTGFGTRIDFSAHVDR